MKKKLTIVRYLAFGQEVTDFFIDKSDWLIKEELRERCVSYIVIGVFYGELSEEFRGCFKVDHNTAGFPGYLQTYNNFEKL